MQIVPDAVGQSDGTVVFWEDHAEIGVTWPQSAQVIDEIRWGVGSVNQEDCLILYLFSSQKVAELYLPAQLPTSPNESIDVWKLLCAWRPELIKVRYGAAPTDGEKEVNFLLPASEGEDIVDKLESFRDTALAGLSGDEAGGSKNSAGESSSNHHELLARVTSCLEESVHSAG